MENFNFTTINKADPRVSNYRLLDEPTKLVCRTYEPWMVPDGDGWDYAGGCCATPVETTTEEANQKREVVMRLGRKQRAAKLVRPIETIKVVPVLEPAVREVVEVRLAGGSAQDEEVALLTHKIKELVGVVERPKREAEAAARVAAERKHALDRLEALFVARHTR